MLIETATVQESHARFIRRVIETETVWFTESEDKRIRGCDSNEDLSEGELPRAVMLFWSDAAYARRAVTVSFPECKVVKVSLFDFLFRLLPGMEDGEFLIGTNYTAHLHGVEVEPGDLLDELIAAMSDEMVEAYQERLDAALKAQRGD